MSYSSRRDDYRDSSRRRDSRSPPRRERYSSSSSRSQAPPVIITNVVEFMKAGKKTDPLSDLYNYMEDKTKIKVWTRNFKEVRGILTGYILAYDKHWNLVLRDVDEISLVSKKSKTPFLRDVNPDEELPDMPEKVPRQKKDPSERPPPPPVKIKKEGEEPKKRRPRNKKKIVKRNESMMFVRGDNIVMLSPLSPSDDEEEEDGAEAEAEIVEESSK